MGSFTTCITEMSCTPYCTSLMNSISEPLSDDEPSDSRHRSRLSIGVISLMMGAIIVHWTEGVAVGSFLKYGYLF